MKKTYQIAVDGPAGAGKSTVCKQLAQRLGILYLDTGAMYRAMGLKALDSGIDPQDEAAVSAMAEKTAVDVKLEGGVQTILLDSRDVTGLIRTDAVSAAASAVSQWKAVRLRMVDLQRTIAGKTSIILDGRDIGTYVLPDAEYKFYLTAAVEERARRRFLEQQAKGSDLPLESYIESIRARDAQDMNREFAPLRKAEDAILIDSTGVKPETVIDHMARIVETDDFREPGMTWGKRVFYRICAAIVTVLTHTLTPYKVVGANPRKLKGPYLVCPNHTAKWDALIACEMAIPRKPVIMAKGELMDAPVLKWMLSALGAIGVRRGDADTSAIKAVLGALHRGRIVNIFPEGTRNKAQDGTVKEFHTGPAMLALKGAVPILPVYIANGGKYRIFRKVTVYVGDPVDLDDLRGKRVNSASLTEATSRLHCAVENLRQKALEQGKL